MRAVNLIPPEAREDLTGVPGRSQGAAYAVLVLLAGLALLAVLYGHARRQVASRKAQLASLTERTQQAQERATPLASYTSFITLREEREHAVAQLIDARFDWAHAFHELGRVLPASASITSIQGTVGQAGTGTGSSSSASSGASPASSTPPGSVPQFTLTGCGTSQTQVALTLNRLRLIDGVSEVSLDSSTKSGVGSASGAGGCPGRDPSFTVGLTFDPLPAGPAPGAAAIPASAGRTP